MFVVVTLAGCKDDSTPHECEDVDSIFDSDPCLEALTDACRAHTTQADCWAAEPMKVAVAGDYAYCAWTNVVTVADGQTCEIGDTFGRCEAALRAPWDGPVNACANGESFDGAPYIAFVDAMELVDNYVTGPDGNFYGSLLHWTGSSTALCGDDFVATVPTAEAPEWCSCAAAACMVAGD